MTVRRLDATLAVVVIGSLAAAAGTVYLGLELTTAEDTAPKNVIPAGHTVSGNDNTNFIVTGPRATHSQCALEICPKLNASLACVVRTPSARFVGYGWVGLYQDPGAAAAKMGWDSWANGCESSSAGLWRAGEPNWRGGSPERCAFGTFHRKSGEGAAEYGGGIYSAPCWSEKPCVCQYGAATTDKYSSAAAALMAEKVGWSAWQKKYNKTITSLLLCVCLATQLGCCCILGAIFQNSKLPAAFDAQTDTEKKAEESPKVLQEAAEARPPVDEEAPAERGPDLREVSNGDNVPPSAGDVAPTPATGVATPVLLESIPVVDKQVAEVRPSTLEAAAQLDSIVSPRGIAFETQESAGQSAGTAACGWTCCNGSQLGELSGRQIEVRTEAPRESQAVFEHA